MNPLHSTGTARNINRAQQLLAAAPKPSELFAAIESGKLELKVMVYPNGRTYHGTVNKEGQREGNGTIIFPANSQYESVDGVFKNNELLAGTLTLRGVKHKLTACFAQGKIPPGSHCTLELDTSHAPRHSSKFYCKVKTIAGAFSGEFADVTQDTPIKYGEAEVIFSDGTPANFRGGFNGYQLDRGELLFEDSQFCGKFKNNWPVLGKVSILKDPNVPLYFRVNSNFKLEGRVEQLPRSLKFSPEELAKILAKIPYLKVLKGFEPQAVLRVIGRELEEKFPGKLYNCMHGVLGIEALYEIELPKFSEIKSYFNFYNPAEAKAGNKPYYYLQIYNALAGHEVNHYGIQKLSKHANDNNLLILKNLYKNSDEPAREVTIDFNDHADLSTENLEDALLTKQESNFFLTYYARKHSDKLESCPLTGKKISQLGTSGLPYLTNDNAIKLSGHDAIEFLVANGFINKADYIDERSLAHYDY
jgi:hypothetical protein